MNYRSKNRNDFSEGANYRSKIHGESSRDANYRSKNRANQNNRCHENAGKFRRNIVSSEISSKSHEKPGISSKFVCITFAQYCMTKRYFVPCYFQLMFTETLLRETDETACQMFLNAP